MAKLGTGTQNDNPDSNPDRNTLSGTSTSQGTPIQLNSLRDLYTIIKVEDGSVRHS